MATSVDVPDDYYNKVLGVDEDKEKAFEDNHNELIKYVNVEQVLREDSPILKSFEL